jgi:hypothetical protein
MDFKSILSQLDQLNEAEGTTVHKGTYGTSHGKEDVRDQYGHKIGKQDKGAETKKDAPKKGRGRPKKGADDSGEVKSYDFSAFGVTKGKDVKLPAHDKKKTTKHSLKEYLDQLESALNEAEQIQIKPASQMPKKPGQTSVPGQPQQVAGQPQKNTQVIQQGDKVLGSVDNPQLAQQIKQSIGKGEMTLMPDQKVDETFGPYDDATVDAINKANPPKPRKPQLDPERPYYTGPAIPAKHNTYDRKSVASNISGKDSAAYDQLTGRDKVNEKDIGKHNNATTGFDALVKKLTPKYGVEAAKRIAGSQLKKIREADQPPHDALASPLTLEAKDLPGNQDKLDVAEPKGKLDAKDFKELSKKKKVKEGMEHKLKAARHTGKAHALSKQGYNCTYDDMEESKHYHEGYKEGLDECYGQMPIQGYVGETTPPATVPGMASQAMQQPAMEDDMYEMDKSEWMTHKAKSTPGDTFKAFGQTFKDKEVLESPFAFEALEQQLNALLESKEEVAEGMTVSISKGQQGAPDSVSVSAQDAEADQLLGLIKSAGLGLFGSEETNGYGAPQGDALQHGGLDVVGDHDGMMALIKKVTGGEAGNGDYADEEGHGDENGHEKACESCGGMMEAGHACGEGQQMVDEVESEDQMTYQVAEDNPPDSGEAEEATEIADTAQANQSAAEYNPSNDIDEGAGGPEASEEPVEKLTPDEENQSDEEGEEAKKEKEDMSESSFFSLYKKLAMLSEESTSEKDDKAEKAAKKVAKDIEYDEDHKGKDDDKAEEAGEKVKKDIEYDDKEDKKEKKLDEWANDAGKKGTDTTFETDIDFMMNVISGGLNKRKQTGQTTIPVISSQLGRQVSRNTTDINESDDSSDAVAQWKKLAGLK